MINANVLGLQPKVVYVGPTIKRGLLTRYTVFRDGGFPASIQELREKSPALRGLFVPVSMLASARVRVKTKGDILNTYVTRLSDELK